MNHDFPYSSFVYVNKGGIWCRIGNASFFPFGYQIYKLCKKILSSFLTKKNFSSERITFSTWGRKIWALKHFKAERNQKFLYIHSSFAREKCLHPIFILTFQIPSFNGKSSHLIFSGLGEKSPLWNDFDLVIRPTSPNGLILYNGDQNNPNGDFVAIFLSNGFIEFAFDAGDGATIVR